MIQLMLDCRTMSDKNKFSYNINMIESRAIKVEVDKL